MTTRNGKIAHLPAQLRNELNEHLENGQRANALADWLNGLDEVQKILAAHFQARPISPQNISEWRHGGFLEWRAERDLLHTLHNSESGAKIADAGLNAGHLIKVFLGRCATAMDLGEEHLARLAFLEPMLKSLLAIQKNELAAERVAIARERLQRKVATEIAPPTKSAKPPVPESQPPVEPSAATSPQSAPLSVVPKHPTPLAGPISRAFPPSESNSERRSPLPLAV